MDAQTLEALAELICGDNREEAPVYRTGGDLTRFFEGAGLPQFRHDGTTRKWWVLNTLRACSPQQFEKVILRIPSPKEYRGDAALTRKALSTLNRILSLESLQVILEGVEPRLKPVKVDFTVEPEKEKLKPLPPPDFLALGLEPGLGELLAQRWTEAQVCVDRGAHLAGIIMMGSLLEGMLLGVMQRNPRTANTAPNVPKDKGGKPKHFANWKLGEMIDVAHTAGWLDLDAKKFSHALRDFRNLIHPYEQLATGAKPDADTCSISWLVVQAATNDLAKVLFGRK